MKRAQYHPIWLRTERWHQPNGTSRPAFKMLLWFRFTILGMAIIVCWLIFVASVLSWKIIDSKLCPTRITCQTPCQVKADGDVAGIGIRYATYIQSFATALLLSFSSNEGSKHAVRATFVMTSLGITASAGIFALQGSLSLPHAMVVVSLLTQTLLPVQIIEPWDVRSPSLFVAQKFRLLVYIAISTWLATKTPCLGSDNKCNLCTLSVTWFLQGLATGSVRRSSILLVNTNTTIYLLNSIIWFHGPMYYLMAVPAIFSEKQKKEWLYISESSQNDIQTWRASNAGLWHWYENEETLHDGLQRLSSGDPRSQRVTLLWNKTRAAIQIPRIQRFALAAIFISIWTYSTERVVKLNLQRNADDWGYGQISAMILSIPSIAGVVQMFVNAGQPAKVDESQELEDLIAAPSNSLDGHDADSNASGLALPRHNLATHSLLPIKRHTQ